MAKALVLLAGAVIAGGLGYVYRADLEPLAARVLPEAALTAIRGATGDTRQAAAVKDGPPASGRDGRAASSKDPAQKANGRRGGGPAPVLAAAAALSDMPIILQAPGTVEPMATVGMKPRVDGQIIEVLFKEGDLVEAGSVLFRLDDRLVRAQIRQADAAIAKDKAALKDALDNQQRKEALLQRRITSEATTGTARQQVEVLRASIAAGEAALEMQKTQLDYLTIRAPITGRTGSIAAKLGSFVRSADPNFIVTINQVKPIAVAFALPQANLPALKAALGRTAQAEITVPAASGGKPQKVTGTLVFVDNQVDKTTGTVTAKVRVDNDNEALWPGQAVVVALTAEVRKNMVSVPASAVLPAQQGMIAWVIGEGDRVGVRVVEQDRVIDQTAFISKGLQAGERVVTDGQLRLTKGARVLIRDPNVPAAKRGKGADKGARTGAAKNAPQAPADKGQPERRPNGRS